MDLGWVQTVDELYTGHNFDQQRVGFTNDGARIQYTYDTVIDELLRDPQKTFVFADIKYMRRWYNGVSQKVQNNV
jgi:hypothetical protein